MTHSTQASLRSQAKAKRLALSPLQHQLAARRLLQKISSLAEFKRANKISIYHPMKGEIHTEAIIAKALEKNKSVYLPAIQRNSRELRFFPVKKSQRLKANHLGIPESYKGKAINSKNLQLVLMPLVAFDKKGNRIGMGGGYYDYTFRHLNKKRFRKTILLGLAHHCQEVEDIKVQDWDVKADKIIAA